MAESPTDLMTSPVVGRRTEGDNDYNNDDEPVAMVVTAGNMDVYKENADVRDSLKRSLAK